jgi:hypothetical protein
MLIRSLSSKISERRAAAFIAAAILAASSAIELARVWFAGSEMLVVDQLLGIATALLLSITATAFITNEADREIAPLVMIAIFTLFAHGGTLAITLSPFGVIYLTAAVIVIALVQVARGKATLGLARPWKRLQTARAAERAASPNRHVMPA